MLESIRKAREAVAKDAFTNANLADAFDAGNMVGLKDTLPVVFGAIEAEIAERYMELPVDADGVPIHVGDSIEYPNGERDVVRFITVNDNMPTFNESGWIASKCRHVKPRTIEDVLYECFHDCMYKYPMGIEPIISKYADELRELGVGE